MYAQITAKTGPYLKSDGEPKAAAAANAAAKKTARLRSRFSACTGKEVAGEVDDMTRRCKTKRRLSIGREILTAADHHQRTRKTSLEHARALVYIKGDCP